MKAVVVLVDPAEHADTVARLIGSTLFMNGYGVNRPAVIDWPETIDDEDQMPPLRASLSAKPGADTR